MSKLYIVYCIDTEGPLHEPLSETFKRIYDIFGIKIDPTKENLAKIQKQELDLNGLEKDIAKVCSPHLLSYNDTWEKIDSMLDRIMIDSYRNKYKDSKGKGIVYNWHCIDHVGFETNERRRDIGYGNIFRHYQEKIKEHNSLDKIHWHFHPLSFNKEGHIPAISYDNSYNILHSIICRRIIDYNWFPVVNRAGFHTIRQDSNLFLEQWIPFDYSNQAEYLEESLNQNDLSDGRYGDWRRAPKEWKPYNPDYTDYQSIGSMKRLTTKCLNIGTRLRLLTDYEIKKAFELAQKEGKAILSFTNHDFRDMSVDIDDIYTRIFKISQKYKNVDLLNCDAIEAMQKYLYEENEVIENKISLSYEYKVIGNATKLYVRVINGSIFGSQPYLAIKTKCGRYYHDNFDESLYKKEWVYTFDRMTINFDTIEVIKVAVNDKYGNTALIKCL